jgi:Asp-tRNA(Asn)/Glu-tRNA(Gln) amidotransferase A subunit family amidase
VSLTLHQESLQRLRRQLHRVLRAHAQTCARRGSSATTRGLQYSVASVPGASVDGLPVGLSIVGGHGSDAALVAVARALEAAR